MSMVLALMLACFLRLEMERKRDLSTTLAMITMVMVTLRMKAIVTIEMPNGCR